MSKEATTNKFLADGGTGADFLESPSEGAKGQSVKSTSDSSLTFKNYAIGLAIFLFTCGLIYFIADNFRIFGNLEEKVNSLENLVNIKNEQLIQRMDYMEKVYDNKLDSLEQKIE